MAERVIENSHSVPFQKRISSRVGRKLTFVLTCVILLVEVIVLVPSYFSLKSDLLSQVRSESVAVLTATLKAEMAMHEGKVSDVGSFLKKEGYLLGGVLHDIRGDERGRFGDPPELTLSEVIADKTVALLREGSTVYEFFVPYQETDLAFNMIVRVDASWITDRLHGFVINVGLIVLFLATACVFGIALALDMIVLNRVLKMRDSVVYAVDRPDHADEFALRDRVRDEVGDLGRALDSLLYAVSNTYQEDLAVALAITEQSSVATLIYGADGTLMNANPSALTLFDAADVEGIAARDPAFLALADQGPANPADLLAEGKVYGKAYLIRGSRRVPCLVCGQTIHRGDGTLMRHFLTLIDLSIHEQDVASERHRRRLMEDKNAELRASLEACMTLLSTMQPSAKDDAETAFERILPERAITDWVQEMQQKGKIGKKDLKHGVLPAISLQEGMSVDLFRNLLSLSLIRVGGRGKIQIAAEQADNGTVEILFITQPPRPDHIPSPPSEESAIVASAVQVLASRSKGVVSIPAANEPDGSFKLTLTVPAADV